MDNYLPLKDKAVMITGSLATMDGGQAALGR